MKNVNIIYVHQFLGQRVSQKYKIYGELPKKVARAICRGLAKNKECFFVKG